jgi:molybdate transport system substrate-binding protein
MVLLPAKEQAGRLRSRGTIMFRLNAYLAALSVATSIATTACSASDILVLSGGSPREALRALSPEFEKLTGHKVKFTFVVDSVIRGKLAAGEIPDMVIVPATTLESLIKAGTLKSELRPVPGTVGIAMGVRQGAASPDISTPDKRPHRDVK